MGDQDRRLQRLILHDCNLGLTGRPKTVPGPKWYSAAGALFFSENDPDRFQDLEKVVKPFHRPTEEFEIKTYFGKFEDAVSEIQTFIGSSFPLIFIDPTGWTGYPFDKIKPLFARPKCEVLINFMYAFVRRFVHSEDEDTITSLNPILGGAGWRNRLDPSLDRGHATEKLFRETLKAIGDFEFVISTKIDKATTEQPHFFIAYGTKSLEGVKAFRQTEYNSLRVHEEESRECQGAHTRGTNKNAGLIRWSSADGKRGNHRRNCRRADEAGID